MNKKCLLAFSYLLFHCFPVLSAQNTQEEQLLTEILIDLKNRYKCDFSYSDEDILSLTLVPPSPKLTFSDAIKYLINNTHLLFNILENKFVTIILPDLVKVTICGNILDNNTGEPIVSATIETAIASKISDATGYFEIKNVTIRDTILVRHLGYTTQKIIVTNLNTPCLNIRLHPMEQLLSEVVLFNYITKGISKTLDGYLNINFEKFGILPGLIESDALQAVQSLPGIHSLNESVTNINIRGGSNDQNLITWDGIKMYQAGHFFNLISAFNPNMTTSVTLIKNGTESSLSDAVSGTIALKSSDKINTNFKTSISVNLININGLLDIPLGKKASIQISGRRSFSDLIDTHTSNHYFEKAFQNTEVLQNESNVISADDNFIFYDIGAVLNYKISNKDKLKISFLNTQNTLSFLESAFINNEEESKESSSKQKNIAFGLFYSRNWNKVFKTTLQVYGIKYSLMANNEDLLNNKQLIQENSIEEIEIKLNSYYRINETSNLNGGYSFNESGIYNLEEFSNPLFRVFSKDVLRKHAIFSEFEFYSLNNKTYLKSGIRLNYIQPFNQFILEPRLNFKHKLLDVLTWDVLGEFKHQTVTQFINFQNDFLGIENRRWIASNNKDIPIIKSKQLSTGLTYKDKGWLINAEIYYKNVRGITTQSQEFRNQFEFSKTNGNYFGNGVDFFINKKMHNLSIWASYSYQNINYKFRDLQSNKFTNNYNLNHLLSLGLAYTVKSFKVATGFKWHSGKPSTNPVFGNEVINSIINYEPANASNLPEYFRWDFSLTHNFKIKETINIHTGISLWNVTDKRNVINKYYRFTDINFPEEVIQNSLEFVPNIIFKVTF